MQSKTKNTISQNKIKELVYANFGKNADLESINEMEDGFFNAVYSLKFVAPLNNYSEMVLKVGVTADTYVLTYEKDIMKTEVFVYKALTKTHVPVPNVIKYDNGRSLIDSDYFFMEKLQGQTWAKLKNTITPENSRHLQYDLGRYTATIHSIKGDYFGYIKENERYQYPTWQKAFRSFINDIISDGRKARLDLPYENVLGAFEQYWAILDSVKEPLLVNYDMWDKNILLIEKNGLFVIEGIIDHERAFFGDPIADFLSTVTICGALEKAEDFIRGYKEIRPFVFGKEEQLRFWMYQVYMGLLIGVEVYRYDETEIPRFMQLSRHIISMGIEKLKDVR